MPGDELSPTQVQSDSLSFRCRPSPGIMVVGGLFFAVCAAVLAWKGHTNDRGLILNGLIQFSTQGASLFYWVLAVLSMLFDVAAAWIVFTTLVHGVPDVIISADSITFPMGFPIKRAYTLPWAEIQGISHSEVNGQRFLLLHTATKKHYIVLNWLASKETAQTLENEIERRLP